MLAQMLLSIVFIRVELVSQTVAQQGVQADLVVGRAKIQESKQKRFLFRGLVLPPIR